MAVEMGALVPMGNSSGLSEQDVRAVVGRSEHPEFTRNFLEDVRTTKECGPKRTAHSQWSKS
jgi:hypothetical protein